MLSMKTATSSPKYPTVYEVINNPDSYPEHMLLLTNRSKHFRNRMRDRFDVKVGLGTYLKLSAVCGVELAKVLTTNDAMRYRRKANQFLGSNSNPRYVMKAVVWDKLVTVLYDAVDRMVVTVFEGDDFTIGGPVWVTKIEIDLGKAKEC